MADIEITHTRAEGTILTGSSKGDGVFELVRPHGFWFSRNVEGLYIKRSRDKEAQHWRINAAADALREAGHTVTVDIREEERRSFEEAEAERMERAAERAERYADRAGRAAATSDARWEAAHRISDGIPMGQPILVGHHSERRARRDVDRMHGHMAASIDAGKKASYYADRAKTAERYEAFRNDPHRTLRRLDRLGADLRQQERYVARAQEEGWDAERHERLAEDLREEIACWQKIVEQAKADGVKMWGPEDFAAGDYVLYLGSWYQVKRVNAKTLSVAWNLRLAPKQVMTLEDADFNGRTSTHSADYTQVRGRCPEAAMTAFLADGKVPGAKTARAASEEQPASAVREALAAKPKTKAKGTAKRRDPKVPARVHVTCDLGGTEATLTWQNGNSRPHKDHPPVTITPPEGERFHRAVWSKLLQEEIGKLLAEHGWTYGGDDWTVSRDRSGFVRAIEPLPAQPERPAEEPAAEEAAPVEAEAPVDEPAATAEGETEGAEKTPLTRENVENTRNHEDPAGVVHSEYALRVETPQEDPMPTETETYGRPLTRKERKAVHVAVLRAKSAVQPEVERTAELDDAYRTYVDDGIASTDGWYAPLDFQAWATTLGGVKVEYPVIDTRAVGLAALAEMGATVPAMEEEAAPVAEQPKVWGPGDFRRGDFVQALDRWFEVKRVNPRSVSIEDAPYLIQWAMITGQRTAAEQAEAEAAAVEPVAEPIVEETPEEAAAVEPIVEEAPEEAEKTPLTRENVENTRNHEDPAGVVHSDYALSASTEEDDMTATTATAKATTTKKAAKKATEPKAPAAAEVKTVQRRVAVDRIDRDASQPREEFDQAKLEELAGSMRKLGQLQPVSLRYNPGTKRFTLIMGERRWRAAQMAGLTELDAVVVHGVQEGDRETLAKQVAENVGRADMTPIEEAKSFKRLLDAEYTLDEVAEMCGKSTSYIGWRVDLLRLCDAAQEALGKGHLPVGMAWYVSLLSCDNQMRFLAKYARGAFPNDRAAEEFVKACRAEEKRRSEQGSFFVLADETAQADGGTQEEIPGAHDVSEEERERIGMERSTLTKKIDRLSTAGEILSELATADPEELALLLGGTPGGVAGHELRIEHLKKLIGKASSNLRKAQAIAEVRASGIVINPEAAA
ncbi:DUF3560 domain-containing protein [Streptomyces sp. NBC_00425]|uniref:DUF3560 domain-containing protein n=1 Tax=Streptomyces sp. NBC_00425 TaxID=2975740 RepID=UPI002E1C8657